MSAGSYLVLWTTQGDELDVSPDVSVQSLDAARQRFIDSFGNLDSILTLTQMNGEDISILASQLVAWQMSTPESRAEGLAHEAAKMDEKASHRAIYGDDTVDEP